MAVVAYAWPILPGKGEHWRRFVQEAQGSRRRDHEDSLRLRGVSAELMWLSTTPLGDIAVTYLEAEVPERVLSRLAASQTPFDLWYKGQLRELHGLDATRLAKEVGCEAVCTWQAPLLSGS